MHRLVIMALAFAAAAAPSAGQSSGRFHLVRSVSGSKGAPDGSRFVFEDPRSVFQAGEDRRVMVTFEWQGPPGRHRCEGTWKDPSGKVVYTSEAEVNARGNRFGVYWGLSLPDTVATGTWVVEARVDGELAGAHAFQIQSEALAPGAPPRRALSVAELYEAGLARTLTLEVRDAGGSLQASVSGFFVARDLVSTSFAGLNGARAVRLTTPRGAHETSELVSWNRPEDWAILRFAGAAEPDVARAAEPPQVGDRCFYLDAQPGGGRVIVETSVIGRADGDLTLEASASEASLGAPVFNELGEVVAALAGSGVLGASVLELHALAEPGQRARPRGARARRLPPLPDPAAAARALQDVEEFVQPLVRTPHFLSGVLGTEVERGRIPNAVDQRVLFSRSDGRCVVFVTWIPGRKEDGSSQFQLYDADGRRVGESEARKLKLRSGQPFVQYWEVALDPLRPAVYRVDLLLGPNAVWRTFFRLSE